MLQGFDHPIFRWTTFPQMGTSRVEQKSPARRSCQENFVGNGKSAKAFPQQSYAEAFWTVPHRAVPHTPLASFHFRIAGTSDLQNRTLGRQRLGGASLSHLPSGKSRRPAALTRKRGQMAAGRQQLGTTTAPAEPAISPTSQEGSSRTSESRASTCRCATTTDPQAASSSTSQEGLEKTASSER